MYLRDVDRTAVGFHKRRILLSQHYSKQNISGVPGFEQAHSGPFPNCFVTYQYHFEILSIGMLFLTQIVWFSIIFIRS